MMYEGWWAEKHNAPLFTLVVYFIAKVQDEFPILAGQVLVCSFDCGNET